MQYAGRKTQNKTNERYRTCFAIMFCQMIVVNGQTDQRNCHNLGACMATIIVYVVLAEPSNNFLYILCDLKCPLGCFEVIHGQSRNKNITTFHNNNVEKNTARQLGFFYAKFQIYL